MDSRDPPADLVEWATRIRDRLRARFPRIARSFDEIEAEGDRAQSIARRALGAWFQYFEYSVPSRWFRWIGWPALFASVGFMVWFTRLDAEIHAAAPRGSARIGGLALQFATDATTIRYILASWGDAGRELFAQGVRIDFGVIPCYALAITCFVVWLARGQTKGFARTFGIALAAAFPLAMLSDAIENILLLRSLGAFPQASAWRGTTIAFCAFVKWSWILTCFTTMAGYGIASLRGTSLGRRCENTYLGASPLVQSLYALPFAVAIGAVFFVLLRDPIPGKGMGMSLSLLVGFVLPLGLLGQPRSDLVVTKSDEEPVSTPPPPAPRIMKMIPIAGGVFRLGSPPSEEGRFSDEGPIENVRVAPFEIGETVVTREQWRAVMGAHAARPEWTADSENPEEGRLPANHVSWFDALEFCNRASALEGRRAPYELSRDGDGDNVAPVAWDRSADGYRLPIEAEWEFAARGGTTTRFPWGEDPAKLDDHAWWLKNSDRRVHPVAEKLKNRFGLHDCIGNVWEWCFDAWKRQADPDGADDDLQSGRVVRGGSFVYADPRNLRSACRYRRGPEGRGDSLGFRCVAAPLRQHDSTS